MGLYEFIEALCSDRGISVTQMCSDAGVARASLSDLKSGRNKSLSSGALSKIANYFGITVDELVTQGKANQPVLEKENELMEDLRMLVENPETRALLHATKGMKPEQVRQMADFIKGLRNSNDN